jgi:hypothetical protein
LRVLLIGVIPTDRPPHAESALRSYQNLRLWAILKASAITNGSREFVFENECLRRCGCEIRSEGYRSRKRLVVRMPRGRSRPKGRGKSKTAVSEDDLHDSGSVRLSLRTARTSLVAARRNQRSGVQAVLRFSAPRSHGNCASRAAIAAAVLCGAGRRGATLCGGRWGSPPKRSRRLRAWALPPRAPMRRNCSGDWWNKR